MNIIYCLESVVGSTIAACNWYFSSERSYNKIIKFKSRWRWLYMNIKASIEKYSYFRTTLDSLNVYLIKCNLLMRFDCGSFIWTCFIIEWYVWAAIHMRDRCFRWSDKNGWSCNLREIWDNYLDCKNLTFIFSPNNSGWGKQWWPMCSLPNSYNDFIFFFLGKKACNALSHAHTL